jgi:hypothetical protein
MKVGMSVGLPLMAIALTVGALVGNPKGPALAQREPIYGSRLMTQQERDAFRDQMRTASSIEEREQLRLEHYLAMQERAK